MGALHAACRQGIPDWRLQEVLTFADSDAVPFCSRMAELPCAWGSKPPPFSRGTNGFLRNYRNPAARPGLLMFCRVGRTPSTNWISTNCGNIAAISSDNPHSPQSPPLHRVSVHCRSLLGSLTCPRGGRVGASIQVLANMNSRCSGVPWRGAPNGSCVPLQCLFVHRLCGRWTSALKDRRRNVAYDAIPKDPFPG